MEPNRKPEDIDLSRCNLCISVSYSRKQGGDQDRMEMEKKLGEIHRTYKVPNTLSHFQLMVYYFYGRPCSEST